MTIKHWNSSKVRRVKINGRYTSLKTRIKNFFRKVVIGLLLLVITAASYFIAFTVGQITVDTSTLTTVVHLTKETVPPVMVRIAEAESLSNHYCSEELVRAKMCASSELGQVLVKANSNKSIDVGKYQVNVFYWGKKATDLGLDIFKEKDNETMALWIYENYGTDPWSASSKNW